LKMVGRFAPGIRWLFSPPQARAGSLEGLEH
jgi:hypothetical protein